ncbi:leucine-rich repeat-containing protein 45 isoform 1 [Xenopus tropicalis]|uniref:Leucine rich repeat containing 45 n=1 Tax=Xenopus tropicalis TaxID=8364 RepID=F7EJX6_XENTR|nr:leucine-rich repeat-containing protein 45 isoform 1 [Xenopus tropicalis]|eukprot:NP_001184030.1 leucine-rich repeat-containing protein 45 isoform 1 [Xenopus tropicalis]
MQDCWLSAQHSEAYKKPTYKLLVSKQQRHMGIYEMDEFKRLYVFMCQERGSEPQESVLSQMKEIRESTKRRQLDLSTQSISQESCQVLGILLQNDVTFTQVLLSDCMISEDGLKAFLQGMQSNSVIKHLDLKGNNLQAKGGEALGKFLRHTASLTSLTLEWNNLGTWENGFSFFCEGLALNQSLQKLDLRNNQINHKGAEELAMALQRNSTLQELDLRWNNIGLLGGRAIQSCFESNKALVKLELSGNNISSDVLKAIELCIKHNQERQFVKKGNMNQQQILTKEVQNLKQDKNRQFINMMETIDKQREEMNSINRNAVLQAGKLRGTLEERTSVVNSLTAKLQLMEADLALSHQKEQDLGDLLRQVKQQDSSMMEKHAKELMKAKEEFREHEAKRRRDLAAANEKNLHYRSKIDELERKCQTQQDLVFELKQELTNTTAELKLRAVQAEERFEAEKKRFRQFRDNSTTLHQKEVDHMAKHLEDAERVTQERVQRLEATKLGLEEELSRLKIMLANQHTQAEEELQKVRSFVQLEEQHSAVLHDKLRTLTQSRDQAQNQVLQQNQMIGELQTKNNQLSLEIEVLKRRIDGIQQELATKEEEKLSALTKVRVEFHEQIGHLEAQLATQEGLREKISALERQQKVQSHQHREILLDKESEISTLMEKLRLKDAEILRIREEEAHRACLLQNAIHSFISSSPLGSTTDKK